MFGCVSFRFGSDRFRLSAGVRVVSVWFVLAWRWLVSVFGGSFLFGGSVLILGVGMGDSSLFSGG